MNKTSFFILRSANMSLPFFVITMTDHQFSRYHTCILFYITMDKFSMFLLEPMFVFLFRTGSILSFSFWSSSVLSKLIFVWFLCIKMSFSSNSSYSYSYNFNSSTLFGQIVLTIQMCHSLTVFLSSISFPFPREGCAY